MLRCATLVAWAAGLVGLAFTGLACSHAQVSAPAPPKDVLPAQTRPAARQTIIGVVRAAAPDAPEAATVEVGDVVYKVLKDDNGKTVAREARDRKAEIKGTTESKGKLPLVVWIYGGAWRNTWTHDALPSGNAVRVLVGREYAVASISHRLSQDAVFPAQIEDCKGAIRFLRANAAKYNFDADRIGVWGGSSGGQRGREGCQGPLRREPGGEARRLQAGEPGHLCRQGQSPCPDDPRRVGWHCPRCPGG